MLKHTLLLVLLLLSFRLPAQQWQWALTNEKPNIFSTPGSEAYDIATDPQGNAYITGDFQGSLYLGKTVLSAGNSVQMFLLKYDPCGNLIWSRQTSGFSYSQGWSLSTDRQSNVYVAGNLNGQAIFDQLPFETINGSGFLAKYSPDGTVQWVKSISGIGPPRVTTDSNGNVAVVSTFVNGIQAMLTRLYSPDGQELWQQPLASSTLVVGLAITTDAAHNVYVTGNYQGDLQLGSVSLSYPDTQTHGFLVKYNATGQLQWAIDLEKQLNLDVEAGTGLTLSTDGDVYVTGIARKLGGSINPNSTGFFLSRCRPDGTPQWTSTTDFAYSKSVNTDTEGHVYVSGDMNGPSDFGGINVSATGMFVARYDTTGRGQWIHNAAGNVYSSGAAVYDANLIYAAGFHSGKNQFDSIALDGAYREFFLTRLTAFSVPSSPDATACSGSSIGLGKPPLPHHRYRWSPAAGLSDTTVANPVFRQLNDSDTLVRRSYIVRITDESCPAHPWTGYDTVQVTVQPSYESLRILTGSTTVCPFTGGIRYWVKKRKNYAYQWRISGGEAVSGQGTDTLTVNWQAPNPKAWVEVTATHRAYGCVRTYRIPITVEEILKPDRPRGDSTVCLDTTRVHVYETSLLNNHSTYQWHTDDPTAVTGSRDQSTWQVTWRTTGRKKLWVVEKSQTPCFGSSDTLTVEVYPLPDRTLAIQGPTRVGEYAQLVPYILDGFNGSSYEWSLPDGGGDLAEGQSTSQIRINWREKGEYRLSVRETSREGCVGEAIETLVTVEDLQIPNIITPNQDADNQQWVIKQIAFYPDNRLEIYDRWGQLVHAQVNYDNTWEAKGLSSGVYYYFLRTASVTYKGWVQVLR